MPTADAPTAPTVRFHVDGNNITDELFPGWTAPCHDHDTAVLLMGLLNMGADQLPVALQPNERTSAEIASLAARGWRHPERLSMDEVQRVCASAVTQAPNRPKTDGE